MKKLIVAAIVASSLTSANVNAQYYDTYIPVVSEIGEFFGKAVQKIVIGTYRLAVPIENDIEKALDKSYQASPNQCREFNDCEQYVQSYFYDDMSDLSVVESDNDETLSYREDHGDEITDRVIFDFKEYNNI